MYYNVLLVLIQFPFVRTTVLSTVYIVLTHPKEVAVVLITPTVSSTVDVFNQPHALAAPNSVIFFSLHNAGNG